MTNVTAPGAIELRPIYEQAAPKDREIWCTLAEKKCDEKCHFELSLVVSFRSKFVSHIVKNRHTKKVFSPKSCHLTHWLGIEQKRQKEENLYGKIYN